MDPFTASTVSASVGAVGDLAGQGGSATAGDFAGGAFSTGSFKSTTDNLPLIAIIALVGIIILKRK